MSLLRRIFARRLRKHDEKPHKGTYILDVEWHRSEELRPDRLGPVDEDVEDPERVKLERWRPSRTLGPLP